MKVPIFGGFPVENPTKKANRLKALLRGISLSEYGSEGFRVRLRRLSEYGSVAYLVERPTRETRAEQYSDTVLSHPHAGMSPQPLRSKPTRKLNRALVALWYLNKTLLKQERNKNAIEAALLDRILNSQPHWALNGANCENRGSH